MINPFATLHPAQRTQLLSDCIHAGVVVFVVVCTTVLAALGTGTIPQDVIGAVFGGAIGYAAGRAGSGRTQDQTGGRRATDE